MREGESKSAAGDQTQVTTCGKCDKPNLPLSGFCEDHQAQVLITARKQRRIQRLDVLLVLCLGVLAGVWGYLRINGPLSGSLAASVGRAGESQQPGFLSKIAGLLAAVAPTPADDRNTNRIVAAPDKSVAQPSGRPAASAVGAPLVRNSAANASAASCGNGVVDPGEQCDGQALAGATCASLGFTGDCGQEELCVHSGLTCLRNCTFDYSGCTEESQAARQRFVDHGNGTASDRLTDLTWEMKCTETQCAERHNVLAALPWQNAASEWVNSLNQEHFAGHDDWRLPSLEELRTLLTAVPPCLGEPCAGTVWPRSQMAPAGYWSSTTFSVDKHRAWAVSFADGDVYTAQKSEALHVRAVRKGY